MDKFKAFLKKASENSDLIMASATIALTLVVIRRTPIYVRDVLVLEGGELYIEFSNGSTNTYSFVK